MPQEQRRRESFCRRYRAHSPFGGIRENLVEPWSYDRVRPRCLCQSRPGAIATSRLLRDDASSVNHGVSGLISPHIWGQAFTKSTPGSSGVNTVISHAGHGKQIDVVSEEAVNRVGNTEQTQANNESIQRTYCNEANENTDPQRKFTCNKSVSPPIQRTTTLKMHIANRQSHRLVKAPHFRHQSKRWRPPKNTFDGVSRGRVALDATARKTTLAPRNHDKLLA